MQSVPAFAELWCLSNFSFLRGASQPEELVARAKHLGYAALALCDECSMAGMVRAHVAAKEQAPGIDVLAAEHSSALASAVVVLAEFAGGRPEDQAFVRDQMTTGGLFMRASGDLQAE